jgi:hypothetical protein
MNLKLVVTTMIVAGAVSANAFADESASNNMQAQVDTLRTEISQMQAALDGNSGTNKLTSAGWFNRISLSGLANVDLLGATHYSPTDFTQKSPSSIAVSSAAFYLDANVSDWTKAHIGFAYSTENQNTFNLIRPGAYNYSDYSGSNAKANLDEAYATIANFAKSPFYLKAGKMYAPFGSYVPFQDITPSLTQVMSQVNDPAVVTGFVTNNGFNGSLFALQGLSQVTTQRTAIQNYGASLALNTNYNNIGYNAGVSYLNNMADVTGVEYLLTSPLHPGNQGYTNRIGAVAANLGLKYSAFDLGGKWVGALKQFSINDLNYDKAGAKPAAWDVSTGLSFPVMAHDSRLGLGYQGSKQAHGIHAGFVDGLPKQRYLVDYNVNVSKYTSLGFELRHDVDYTVANGGTGNSANTGVARLAVKFA